MRSTTCCRRRSAAAPATMQEPAGTSAIIQFRADRAHRGTRRRQRSHRTTASASALGADVDDERPRSTPRAARGAASRRRVSAQSQSAVTAPLGLVAVAQGHAAEFRQRNNKTLYLALQAVHRRAELTSLIRLSSRPTMCCRAPLGGDTATDPANDGRQRDRRNSAATFFWTPGMPVRTAVASFSASTRASTRAAASAASVSIDARSCQGRADDAPPRGRDRARSAESVNSLQGNTGRRRFDQQPPAGSSIALRTRPVGLSNLFKKITGRSRRHRPAPKRRLAVQTKSRPRDPWPAFSSLRN